MKNSIFHHLTFFAVFSLILIIPTANADVWDKVKDPSEPVDVYIPSHEYVGFFDSNEIFNVVGNVKNNLNYPIIPTVTISVIDDTQKFTKTVQLTSLVSGNEIPFKIKFPEISNTPFLEPAEISLQKTMSSAIPIDVIYDETLIVHDDGHLTGRIINSGTETISDVEILAIIHGYDHETLDMGESVLPINNFKPGEIRNFSMYPDPSIADDVWYYSCFAVGQDSIIILNVPRNDDTFKIRYDSSILLSYPEFNLQGTILSFSLIQGWAFENYINLEFPRYSENESFQVSLNDEFVDSIQSIDDFGNWHVAFEVESQSEGTLSITGFDPQGELIEPILIPEWIQNDASLWSTGQISDSEFLDDIDYLIKKQIIVIPSQKIIDDLQQQIPSWVKNNAGWLVDGTIDDETFLQGIQYLIKEGIIQIP